MCSDVSGLMDSERESEYGKPQNVSFSAHGKQCVQSVDHANVSKSVQQRSKPGRSAGSWRRMEEVWGTKTRLLRNVLPSVVLKKDGKLMCRCNGPTCATKNKGRGYFDLVPFIFGSEDESGHTCCLCAICWSELNGGVSSVRSFRAEQAQRRKEEGSRVTRCGFGGLNDRCVESILRPPKN